MTPAESDWFHLFLDPHYDHRTGARFAVNPSGVQSAWLLFNDTSSDQDWDAVRDGGHTWPGGAEMPEWFMGKTIEDFDATAEMWRSSSSIRNAAAADCDSSRDERGPCRLERRLHHQ